MFIVYHTTVSVIIKWLHTQWPILLLFLLCYAYTGIAPFLCNFNINHMLIPSHYLLLPYFFIISYY